MANTKSIKKVSNLLEKENRAFSIAEISSKTGLKSNSIHEILIILNEIRSLRILKSNKMTLVQLNKDVFPNGN